MQTLEILEKLSACTLSREWAVDHPSSQDAWRRCTRPDWLLWIVAHTLPAQRTTWVACQIARSVLHYLRLSDAGPARLVISAAEAWTRGEATEHEVSLARGVAQAMYVSDKCAAHANSAAVEAASCAQKPRWASLLAGDHAYEAADCTKGALEEQCEIIRREVAWEEIQAALAAKGLLN